MAKILFFYYICKKCCNFVPILKAILIYIVFLCICFTGCKKKQKSIVTPWGEVSGDTIPASEEFTMSDIVTGGEMILLTVSGPDTYYDYRGRGMGTQYRVFEKFAMFLGVSLRVEVCKDSADVRTRLDNGEGDIMALSSPQSVEVRDSDLSVAFKRWYKPEILAQVKKEERYLLSVASVRRKVYSPFMNRSAGVISRYDNLFKKYAPVARWDWRLLAAQCYQESCFDPNARSWAGARGLMQIMPGTASHLGLSMEQIHEPEANIAAAARYISELNASFGDIPSSERTYFILAAYNGGGYHVRDAMALARKNGRNPYRWADVSHFLLLLRDPQYYNDPVVKNGYMRSNETFDYVERIRIRYAQYRGVPVGSLPSSGSSTTPVLPQPAKKKHRFHV